MHAFRRIALAAAVCSLSACNFVDNTSPLIEDDTTVSLDGGALGVVAATGGAAGASAMLPPLPGDLKLSDAQRAQVAQLIVTLQDDTRADMLLLVAVQRQAEQARRNGKSPDEVRAILQTGAAIRGRIEASERKLRADIEALLTPEQLAWIRSHAPKPCNGAGVVLTQSQQVQIRGMLVAFEQANHADLVAVASAMEQARAAKRAGKTDAEIRAILVGVAPALARLETAQLSLQAQIDGVLTPEQKASGCFTRHP